MTATADGWLHRFVKDVDFDPDVEPELRKAILQEPQLGHFLEQLIPAQIAVGANLFLQFETLTEAQFDKWRVSIATRTRPISFPDAMLLGRVIATRHWHDTAARIANDIRYYSRHDLRPAVRECYHLLSIWERTWLLGSGMLSIPAPSSDELWHLRRYFSDAVAVEMEGLGMLRAGYANAKVRLLVVRGISDLINNKANSDAQGWQQDASEHAAAFAFEVLAHIGRPGKQMQTGITSGNTSENSQWWSELERIAVELYPKGPCENEVWSRAGGDLSLLDLSFIGKAAWHSALRKLRHGGGGRDVSASSLVAEMKNDFPQNTLLRTLMRTVLC